jgi:hypothetical protein
LCNFSNWAKRSFCNKCASPKKMSENITSNEWEKLKEEYSNYIDNVNEWKFNKLDGKKIEEVSTLYEKIVIAQQNKYIEYAQTDPNLKWTIELGIVPTSALLYIKDHNYKKNLNNIDNLESLVNKIKEDTVNDFVSRLWIYHKILFLEAADVGDVNDVHQIVTYVKNIDKYEKEYFKQRYTDDYDQSYAKITSIVIKQFENPELCDSIRQCIIKRNREHLKNKEKLDSLEYPIFVKKYEGFVENPFDNNIFCDIPVKKIYNSIHLWSFILSEYIHDNVSLHIDVPNNKNVKFSWAWNDHSW